jgi:hypothetical protein
MTDRKQEPVAWWNGKESVVFSHDEIYTPNWTDYWTKPLYTTPPPCPTCESLARTVIMDQTGYDPRPWVGLTDEEIDALHMEVKVRLMGTFDTKDIYRAIEAKLKEKNGG